MSLRSVGLSAAVLAALVTGCSGTTQEPDSAAPPAASAATFDDLEVAPEGSRAGYSREEFGNGWSDEDGDGCDVRCEVLADQQLDEVPGLGGPGWFSVYDGEITDDPGELDVDHVVALAEAWDSGASAWSPARREAFANDIGPELIAVTAASNRSKGDDDPAEWQPSRREAWCDFVSDWVAVKVKWGLTADAAEVQAMKNMSRDC